MKNSWNFQILPNIPNIVSHGYRMDDIGESLEQEVNAAMPGYLRFHRVNKIVVQIGPNVDGLKDYYEVLGVGIKQWPGIDLEQYIQATSETRIDILRSCINGVFCWLEETYDDAAFVDKVRQRVSWLSHDES